MVCFLAVAMFLVPLLLPAPARAGWQGPSGFKGLKWGTPLAECSDLMPMEKRLPVVFFQRKGDKLKLGDVPVHTIAYGFNSGIFTTAIVDYEPEYAKVKYVEDALTSKYGKPTREGMNYSLWSFDHGAVTIWHGVDSQKAELRYEITRFPDPRGTVEIGPLGWGDF
jgi:hypothetical protein